MYFKHPEFLYALVLLAIPLLVHLFQLRKFRTEKFTNVRFLRKAVFQTRKSRTLKKWLVLAARLLLFACIIIAFAQPSFSPVKDRRVSRDYLVYLDNSYSLQAKGQQGVLLKRSVQDILEHLPRDAELTLVTNDQQYRDISFSSLSKTLQDLDFSPEKVNWRKIGLLAQQYVQDDPENFLEFLVISDFQNQEDLSSLLDLEGVQTHLVVTRPDDRTNIRVDSAYVSNQNLDELEISVELSSSNSAGEDITVGLYNGSDLLAKKTLPTDEQGKAITTFTLPPGPLPLGVLEVEDHQLPFDDRLFFSVNSLPAVQVMVVGQERADYLQRIFTSPQFRLSTSSPESMDYNELSKAHLIVLNEIEKFPPSLMATLDQLHSQGVFIVLIPSAKTEPGEWSVFLDQLNLPLFSELREEELRVSDIHYEHPLFAGVFEGQVENFQYPTVEAYFPVESPVTPVLSFQNGHPFLFERDNLFVFTAPLNKSNSSFTNSPLIVPSLYNIGNLSISPSPLYYLLGKPEQLNIQASLEEDQIVRMVSGTETFIPRQQSFPGRISLFLEELPRRPGHYQLVKDSVALHALSFNVDREESLLTYHELPREASVYRKVPDVFQELKNADQESTLWKWFVTFALMFLFAEILILKFFR